jgi:hypothetical protein
MESALSLSTARKALAAKNTVWSARRNYIIIIRSHIIIRNLRQGHHNRLNRRSREK